MAWTSATWCQIEDAKAQAPGKAPALVSGGDSDLPTRLAPGWAILVQGSATRGGQLLVPFLIREAKERAWGPMEGHGREGGMDRKDYL